jgi:hypothetical protein
LADLNGRTDVTTLAAADYSFGDGHVLLWMLEFFMFVIWFWLLIAIFSDLFRDHETSGWVKAMWIILVIILPFIGILFYLIFRGRGMTARSVREHEQMQRQAEAQIRAVAGTGGSAADQITQAKSLLDSGVITQAEFDSLKAKALST